MIPRNLLVSLLLRAARCLEHELDAAGEDEVAEHPELLHHQKVVDEIRRALKGERARLDRLAERLRRRRGQE